MEIRLPIFTHNHVILSVSAVFVYAGVFGVLAIDVFTPAEVFVENGTTATLSCSFKSKEVISSSASVTWSFLPEGDTGPSTLIFYRSGGTSFLTTGPRFKSRVEWAGDMNKNDASIRVIQMQFKDNGTFSCDVKNPPDVSGQMSTTKVRVVPSDVSVFTPAEVFIENGTTATLSCSFKSKELISSLASVTWSFLPDGETGLSTTIFYYSGGKSFLSSVPQFKSRVEWAGDMNKNDASIRVIRIQVEDSGTFSCDVKNPPDVSILITITKVRVAPLDPETDTV